MTPWHYRWLCQFSYMDLPESARAGQTLGALAREMLALDERGQLPCGSLTLKEKETLAVILQARELSSLTLIEFINRNKSTGLAAYIFKDPDSGVHMIFRGSERRSCTAPTGIDWLDNFLAPFAGSVQYPEIAEAARRYPEERIVFSGHSKGAHNALYALSSVANERAQAVAFNGQGFAPGMFSKNERRRLRNQGINYVVRGDLVGSLLHHPEKRVFVKKQGKSDPHALESIAFDRQGQPVPARRPFWSAAVEWGTVRYMRNREMRPGQAL